MTKLEQAARRALEAFPTMTEFFNRYVESIDGPYFNEAARIALMAVRELPRIEGALREAMEQPEPSVEPVLVVELEPSYMSRGHFYKGDKPHIDPTKVWKLPIGTKLYTAPRPTRQPLTEGELDLILQKSPIKANYADLTALVRAVEKVHGIGGEA